MNASLNRSLTASVSPQGRFFLEMTDDTLVKPITPLLEQQLIHASQLSASIALTLLASKQCEDGLNSQLDFWRRFGLNYFQALCRSASQDLKQWISPEPPSSEDLQVRIDSAPTMRGIEYLHTQSLVNIWNELDQHTQLAVKSEGKDLADYLHRRNETWNLIGRVTFHLAENKKNPERPFAFLATFTDGRSKAGALRHIPLADALKQSIADRDTDRLNRLLEPVQRASEKSELIRELLDSHDLFSPQAWSIAQAYQFLSTVPLMESAGIIVRVPNWWNASRPPRPSIQVRIGDQKKPGIGLTAALDFNVGIAFQGEPLSDDELQQLMAAREGMTLLRGQWVQVDENRLAQALDQWQKLKKQHATGIGFLEGLRLLSGATIGDSQVDDETRQWSHVEAGEWLQGILNSLRDPSGAVSIDPQHGLNATLRKYQADGVRWLWFTTQLGLGACLADDMGLGKTIQVISLLLQYKRNQAGHSIPKQAKTRSKQDEGAEHNSRSMPSLLIAPTSLLGNWQREIERFAPDLKLFVAHRSHHEASTLKRIAQNPEEELVDYDLVATTYGLARRDAWLENVPWRLLILDEAQAIKNAGSSQTKAIKKLRSTSRIVLTGTPVENHLGDLWSLFDFCSPGLLGSATQFKRFLNHDEARGIASLRKLVRPYILRRLKTDPNIAPDLPDKTEMRVDCGLSAKQAALYQNIVLELEKTLDVATGIQRRGLILGLMMQLKQLCNHPALYLKQADFVDEESGKFAELQAICETISEKQEKVLVFTQFQSMCQPLHDFLEKLFGRSGLVLTGKTPAASRGKMVALFQEETGPPFFVISVKAGGTGLNLTQASHVVHFDRWWNPAVEDQATDRAFRIGQKRNVLVHKFVCRGTLEEKIDKMIQDKKAISQELFSDEGELKLTEMNNEQLMQFVALDINKASS
jgi:hypothetical protein